MYLKLLFFATIVQARFVTRANVVGRDVVLRNTYDFVVVGGGTSGLTVADRLTEDPNVSVLVVEDGPFDHQENEILVPGLTNTSLTLPYWFPNLTSLPQPGFANKTFNVTIARVVGGGSTINGMVIDRGGAPDYNAWEQLGNPGWGWDGLLPYFKKSETFTAPDNAFAVEWNISWDMSAHGSTGPIQASYPNYQFRATKGFTSGFSELGVPTPKDPSAGTKRGVFWVPSTVDPKNRTRSYARIAHYDRVVEKRPNYHLLPLHSVGRVLFEGKRAVGVVLASRETGEVTTVNTSKETILAAGAIHTPQILQLSGIGDERLLQKLKVEVTVDLPGVGYNFQDHPYAMTLWNFSAPLRPTYIDRYTNSTLAAEGLAEYFTWRTGPYVIGGGNTIATLPIDLITASKNATASILALAAATTSKKVYPRADTPEAVRAGWDAQHAALLDQYGSTDASVAEFAFNTAPGIPVYMQKPLSRGFVAAATAQFPPLAPPVIDYGGLMAPSDMAVLIAGIRRVRQLMRTEAARAAFGDETVEVLPVPNSEDDESDEALAALIRVQGSPNDNHPVGTCPMMRREEGGVVNSDLEVYGVQALSIVDASVMPLIPATHICSTVYAVAEKAADIIKHRNGVTIGAVPGIHQP